MKAGTNAEDLPSLFFPTVVGIPRRRFQEQYKDKPLNERIFVGEQAIANRQHLTINNPIDHGHIDDWEQVRTYTYVAGFRNYGLGFVRRQGLPT